MQHRLIPILCLSLTACAGKAELDTTAEQLMAAYGASDYTAFKAIMHPDIVEQIPEHKFNYTAKALAMLGTPTDRSMKGISVKAGGPSEGTYVLTYPTGEVELKLKVFEGTIVSFNVSGGILTDALRKAASAEFKISSFEFLEGKGGPPKVGSSFTQGELIAFRMHVLGLTEKEHEIHMRMLLEVLSPEGEVLFKKLLIDDKVKLPPEALPTASPTGSLTAGNPGPAKLRLTIEDVYGERKTSVEQDLTVKPGETPPPAKGKKKGRRKGKRKG